MIKGLSKIILSWRPSQWSVEHALSEQGRLQTWPAVAARMSRHSATTTLERYDYSSDIVQILQITFWELYPILSSSQLNFPSKTSQWEETSQDQGSHVRTTWSALFSTTARRSHTIIEPSLLLRMTAPAELETTWSKTTYLCARLVGRAVQGDRWAFSMRDWISLKLCFLP